MPKPLLEAKNICYSYHSLQGETPALKDVSFSINSGEFVAMVGPSGCGKSTLLSVIYGLLRPESGEIIFHSDDISGKSPKIGYMLQRDHLWNGAVSTKMPCWDWKSPAVGRLKTPPPSCR